MFCCHVYATLWPTEDEQNMPHISMLIPLDDTPMSQLDDLAKNIVHAQFYAKHEGSEGIGES